MPSKGALSCDKSLAASLLSIGGVRDFAFAEQSRSGLPRHNRSSYAVVAVLYVVVVALLIHWKTQPTRVASAGSPFASMTAYVPGAAAAGSTASTSKPVEPKKPALTTKAVKAVQADDQAAGGAAGVVGAGGAGSGPVRFGSGGSLSLIKRVQPVYPSIMQSARMTGQVVLDDRHDHDDDHDGETRPRGHAHLFNRHPALLCAGCLHGSGFRRRTLVGSVPEWNSSSPSFQQSRTTSSPRLRRNFEQPFLERLHFRSGSVDPLCALGDRSRLALDRLGGSCRSLGTMSPPFPAMRVTSPAC